MKPGIIVFVVLIGIALIIISAGAMTDASNLDMISPMPSPYPQDTTSDVITLSDEPLPELSEAQREVAVVDEITDYGRDVSGNQLAQAEDATGALTAVTVAGYGAMAAIVGGYNMRDIVLVIGLIAALWLLLRILNAAKKNGGER